MQKTKMILWSGTQPTIEPWSARTKRVATPLDAIMRLERAETDRRIGTIVLAGGYAYDPELVRFLEAFYPRVRIERDV